MTIDSLVFKNIFEINGLQQMNFRVLTKSKKIYLYKLDFEQSYPIQLFSVGDRIVKFRRGGSFKVISNKKFTYNGRVLETDELTNNGKYFEHISSFNNLHSGRS